jgi:uncharacterized membrane protein HdeD (DUF308 family)
MMMSTLPSPLLERIKASRPLLITFGILLIVSGLLFVTFTGVATLTSVYLFGLLMIFAGVLQAITAVSALSGGQRWLWLLFSLLYILAGYFAFEAPLATASALTWLIAAFIIVGGFVRFVSDFQVKAINGWGWVLFSGVLLFVTGLLIAINPSSPLWLLGLMLGLDLLFQGINLLILSLAIKKL